MEGELVGWVNCHPVEKIGRGNIEIDGNLRYGTILLLHVLFMFSIRKNKKGGKRNEGKIFITLPDGSSYFVHYGTS